MNEFFHYREQPAIRKDLVNKVYLSAITGHRTIVFNLADGTELVWIFREDTQNTRFALDAFLTLFP